jgi:poly(A) polymerase
MAARGILAECLPGGLQLARLEKLIPLEGSRDAILRLAALLPAGAAGSVADGLRLSNADRLRLEQALGDEAIPTQERAARRELYRLGKARFRDRLLLQWAGAPAMQEAWRALLTMAEEWQPPRFPLSGSDVMQLGVVQGPEVGRLLSALENWWMEGDFAAGESELRARLRDMIGQA